VLDRGKEGTPSFSIHQQRRMEAIRLRHDHHLIILGSGYLACFKAWVGYSIYNKTYQETMQESKRKKERENNNLSTIQHVQRLIDL
jgi:hypothetical protein